jgi:site-specific DNA-methyltransferase (cytosine-N4-specific)
VYVSHTLDGGFKSELKSIDLEFEREGVYHMVGIKSGTNWGNSDQVNRMRDNFKAARHILRGRGVTREIVAVNGCIYGKDRSPFKMYAASENLMMLPGTKFAGFDLDNILRGEG